MCKDEMLAAEKLFQKLLDSPSHSVSAEKVISNDAVSYSFHVQESPNKIQFCENPKKRCKKSCEHKEEDSQEIEDITAVLNEMLSPFGDIHVRYCGKVEPEQPKEESKDDSVFTEADIHYCNVLREARNLHKNTPIFPGKWEDLTDDKRMRYIRIVER